MKQLIDKSAVVAEIERRIVDNKKDIERASHKNLEDYFEGYEDALALLKQQYLDTLEVKEVDSTDAFIEKVVNFLEILGYAYTITDNITKSLYDNTQLIEDFKKYMEE